MTTGLAAINKFQNHPSAVNNKQKEFNPIFSFNNINENEVRKIIKNPNIRKTCHGSDIPTKIIKLNIDVFSSFICQHFNYLTSIDEFPSDLKQAHIMPVHKKGMNVIKLTIGQLVYFQTFEKFMRKSFIINFMNTSMTNNFLVNLDFVRDTVFQREQDNCLRTITPRGAAVIFLL